MTPTRVRLSTLVREELRALPRNGFALAAVAVVLGLFVPIGMLGYGGEGGMSEMLLFSWLVLELVVAIVVAARVAAARRSRFVDSLYTTPLDQATWLAAQVVVGFVLAALVLAVQVPYLLVHVAFLGVPAMLPPLFAAALGMAVFAVALGVFCGVIVADSGAGAAAGLAGGIAFLAFVMFIVHGIALTVPPSPMQAAILRVTALSPLALVTDAAAISIFDMLPSDPWRPVAGLTGLVAGLGAAAWFAYTRAQGPLGWEAKGGRPLVVALVALALVAPLASAEVDFRPEDDEGGFSYSPGEFTQVAFVERGAAIHDETFTLSGIYSSPDLPLGKIVELDALVLLTVAEGTSVRGVRIEVQGSDAVRVESGGTLVVPDGRTSERGQKGEGWSVAAEGPSKPVYRVPVALRAIAVESLGDSPARVDVRTEFIADGRALLSHARLILDGKIDEAYPLLALAGAPLPLAALTAIVARKVRTR